jgi:hypothetical protein
MFTKLGPSFLMIPRFQSEESLLHGSSSSQRICENLLELFIGEIESCLNLSRSLIFINLYLVVW